MNSVQTVELEVLKEIIKVLESHKLTYYAIGGTCLGAIRHKGFIPWDDDIDIGMPRTDYEKFRTEYYKELPDYLEKLDGDNAKHHSWMFMKIHDARTTYISNYAAGKPDIYTGAFVDIMPIDGLPDHEDEREQQLKKLNRCFVYNAVVRDDFKKIDSFTRLIKEVARFILKCSGKWNRYHRKFQELSEKYDYSMSNNVYYGFFLYTKLPIERISFPRVYFDKTIKVPFEDIMINIPSNYDDYLKTYFGDYMQFPPEEKRNSGHESIACDMKTSFREFKFS